MFSYKSMKTSICRFSLPLLLSSYRFVVNVKTKFVGKGVSGNPGTLPWLRPWVRGRTERWRLSEYDPFSSHLRDKKIIPYLYFHFLRFFFDFPSQCCWYLLIYAKLISHYIAFGSGESLLFSSVLDVSPHKYRLGCYLLSRFRLTGWHKNHRPMIFR